MHNKPPCRNFAIKGTCTFGSNCRFDHYTETPLVDPPSWIFSCFTDTDLNEFSPEEMHAYFSTSCNEGTQQKFTNHYDSLWLENYKCLSDKLSEMSKHGTVTSDTERVVDFRKQPDIFCKPFNENILGLAREECNNEPMEVEEEKMWGSNENKGVRLTPSKPDNETGDRSIRKTEGKYDRKFNDSSAQKRNSYYEGKHYSDRKEHGDSESYATSQYNKPNGRPSNYNRHSERTSDNSINRNKDDSNASFHHHDKFKSTNKPKESLDSFFKPEHEKKEDN